MPSMRSDEVEDNADGIPAEPKKSGGFTFPTQEAANHSESNSVTPSGRARKRRKKSSWVWNHFEVQGSNIVCLEWISKNKPSPALFAPSTATGNLSSHVTCVTDEAKLLKHILKNTLLRNSSNAYSTVLITLLAPSVGCLIVAFSCIFHHTNDEGHRAYSRS